jgi:putative aldouronate transport system substrate-binding protein
VIGGCIVDNDLGLPSLKMANGVYLCTSGGFIYDTHKYDLEYTDLQLEAYTVWLNEADDPSTVTTSGIPSGAKMNVSEADAVSAVMSDITTHVAEMALKFVTGATELNEQTYAQYVQDIENMNLQEALDAEQSAYDRYLSR